MATPSSSATSPSPPLAFLSHVPTSSKSPSSTSSNAHTNDDRKKAVQKFIARAELGSVTRALRQRLSYASFKVNGTSSPAGLRELDAVSPSQSSSGAFSRSSAVKRKLAPNAHYYGTPATQSPGTFPTGSASPRWTVPSSMAPPTGYTSRPVFPGVNGGATAATSAANDPPYTTKDGPPRQTLFTSILAPPPAKQARTILNAGDPPVAAPARPAPSPQMKNTKVARSIAEGTRLQAKSRAPKAQASPSGSPKRKPTSSKRSKRSAKAEAEDMKAAAALTSLLLHHRPSVTGSASSPRSSVDGSDTGSAYSQFPRAPPRTAQDVNPSMPVASQESVASTMTVRTEGEVTPPGSRTPVQRKKAAPTDNDAAELMLFLATSPSPARPSNKDAKDMAAFKALSGGPGLLQTKPRVLFPTAPADSSNADTSGVLRRQSQPHPLSRGAEASFTSSVSSIGSEMGVPRRGSAPDTVNLASKQPSMPVPVPAQLLPPPSLPATGSAPGTPTGYRKIRDPPSRPSSGQGAAEFNINEFINASPSPSHTVQQVKNNPGLRADVGRKLFQEEQMRLAGQLQGFPRTAKAEERTLEAGIDLVKS